MTLIRKAPDQTPRVAVTRQDRIEVFLDILARNARAPWRLDAACRWSDPEDFYPDGTGNKTTKANREHAERVIGRYCDACPVRDACLDDLLAIADVNISATVGIRGGICIPNGPRRDLIDSIRATRDAATPTPCTCRHTECPSCGPRMAVEARNSRVGSGTAGGRGPDLQTAPYSRRVTPPGMRIVDTPRMSTRDAARAAMPRQRRERHADVQRARDALTAAGATWADAKQWALDNLIKAADVKTFRPRIVDAYLASLTTRTPAEASA